MNNSFYLLSIILLFLTCEDISTILQKTGDLLATQAALGYDKVQNSNHAAIRASVATIQSIVNNIVERCVCMFVQCSSSDSN